MSVPVRVLEEAVDRLLRDNEKLVAEVEVLQRKHDQHMADIARANALQEQVDQLTDECDRLKRQVDDLHAHRHHEVLCLVLRDSIAHTSEAQDANRAPDFVRLARLYADLAYPPPKAEGT